MVQPHHNFAPYLRIETKFLMRKKKLSLYFSKSFGKMSITNPFILTVKAGRKLAISQREKKSVVNTTSTVLVAISNPDLP